MQKTSADKIFFEELISPHLDTLYRRAFRLTFSKQDAEDLLQQLVLNQFKSSVNLSEIKELEPWLMRALLNLYIDTYRKKKRSALDLAEQRENQPLQDQAINHLNPEIEASKKERLSLLIKAIEGLDEDSRTLITLNALEGLSLQEIEQLMNVPIGTLKSRLHRARKKIKESIKKMQPSSRIFVEPIKRSNQVK